MFAIKTKDGFVGKNGVTRYLYEALVFHNRSVAQTAAGEDGEVLEVVKARRDRHE